MKTGTRKTVSKIPATSSVSLIQMSFFCKTVEYAFLQKQSSWVCMYVVRNIGSRLIASETVCPTIPGLSALTGSGPPESQSLLPTAFFFFFWRVGVSHQPLTDTGSLPPEAPISLAQYSNGDTYLTPCSTVPPSAHLLFCNIIKGTPQIGL